MHVSPTVIIPEHQHNVFHIMLRSLTDGEEGSSDVFTAVAKQVVRDMEEMNNATRCDVFLMFLCYCSLSKHMDILESSKKFKRFFNTIKQKQTSLDGSQPDFQV